MNEHTIKLIDFIKTKVIKDPAVEISPVTGLFEKRLLNSMNILDLIGYVEANSGKKIDTGDLVMSNFKTVDDIVKNFLHE